MLGNPPTVSVLFSEPKIPQTFRRIRADKVIKKFQCSSASRKFLKGACSGDNGGGAAMFQCSSASRKFLKWPSFYLARSRRRSFSALQRAENSSNEVPEAESVESFFMFQCSSASRKFLKALAQGQGATGVQFQCSSASRKFLKDSAVRPSRSRK